MMHTLEVDSIQLAFGDRRILADIYLRCETGKITGLLGRNGQGKSCLLQIIYGSRSCEKSVRVDTIPLFHAFQRPEVMRYLPQFNFIPARLTLQRVFQDFDLAYAAFAHRFPEFTDRPTAAVGELSGGERRLVELYVVVKSATQFVLLDEPFTHLNPLQIEQVKALLLAEKREKGFLLTDHLFRHVLAICDAVNVLAEGKLHRIQEEAAIESLGYARL